MMGAEELDMVALVCKDICARNGGSDLFYRMRSRGARPALTTFVERVSTLSDSPEATLIIESGALQGVQEVVDYNTGQIC